MTELYHMILPWVGGLYALTLFAFLLFLWVGWAAITLDDDKNNEETTSIGDVLFVTIIAGLLGPITVFVGAAFWPISFPIYICIATVYGIKLKRLWQQAKAEKQKFEASMEKVFEEE